MDAATVARLFPTLGRTIYLNTASVAPGLGASADALRAAVDAWGQGRFDFVEAERAGELARSDFAELIGVTPDRVAIIPAASAVAGLVATHLERRHPAGGNVVVGAEEFSSNLYPWRGLSARGFEVREIPFRDGAVPEDEVTAAVDARTRLIAVSAVQSASGYRADLERLRASSREAILYVDAAQAAGSVALDLDGQGIDALAAPSHKFLLGIRGMGYGAFSARLLDSLDPVWPGWKATEQPLDSFYGPTMTLSPTASRLDQSLAWMSAIVERESLGTLRSLGFARVAEHGARLSGYLRARLREAQIPFVDHGEAHGSAIVSCAPTGGPVAERLAQAGIVAGSRAGRIRLSVHVCNTEAHIDRAIEALTS
jgi:cysteine desulfurase/selenocysteine lyase